jgi:peptidylprolyl isomerase
MKLTLLALSALIALPLFCAPVDDWTTTDSGLQYKITQKGRGVQPQAGDGVKVHYKGTLENGVEFDNSFKRNQPIAFELGAGRVIAGWDEGIALLHQGDKAIFRIPPELGYGARAVGPIPANATLTFEVELVDVLRPVPYDTANKVAVTTDSGLKFFLIEKGSGRQAVAGDNATVHYTGYLPDGSIFDSSIPRDQVFKFAIGMGQVIAGWDEGVAMMHVGDKARLEIPYQLAYGEKGIEGIIPPKATLIFDVELIALD